MSDAFLGNKCPFGLTWVLCWEEEEESLKMTPLCLFWIIWERKKRMFEIIGEVDQAIKQSLYSSFWSGLECI